MEEAIRVCIRQRPLFQKEIDAGHVKAWKLSENGELRLEITPPQGVPIKKAYAFDMCFDETCSNELVYEKTAKDIVKDTANGINGCYMAYGQTGCGKTHSIMGTATDPGILPRSVAELFDVIEQGMANADDDGVTEMNFLLRVSYVEIYLERVNDLLQDGPKGEGQPLENLDVKEDPKGGFYVVGLAEMETSSIEDVMHLLQKAEMKRHFARTNFNETSSRSHTVFGTNLECTQTYSDGATIVKRGELKLVDLAGNERASAAEGVEGAKERQAEGQAINKSLFLLSEVIAKLSKKAEAFKKGSAAATERAKKEIMHIPWRDSKLTRLLQKSLAGNSRAALLVAVHPSTQALEISLSTLRFALKTKQIKKKIQTNFVSPEQSIIMGQKEQIKILQAQLKAIQEMTGVEIPQEIQDKYIHGPTKTKVVEKPASNAAIEKLKTELQKKLEKLSKIILSSRFQRSKSKEEEEKIPEFGRSITMAGVQDRYERFATLVPSRHAQLYQTLPAHAGEPEKSKIKSIAGALQYLKAIDDMNRESSEIEQQQIEEFGASDLSRYDTVKLEDLVAEEEFQHQEMKSTRKKITALRHDNARLVAKNSAYLAQADYLQTLLQKLGLSILMTSTDVATVGKPPALSSRLGTPVAIEQLPEKSHKAKLIDYLEKIQPMAFAMVSRLVCSALERHLASTYPGDPRNTTIDKERERALRNFHVEKKVDSIFTLLSPWEQHMLALLYEQHEVRASIKGMTTQFKDEIINLQRKAEKMELTEHCTRLLDELRHYRYEIVPKADPTANDTFSKLLNQLDTVSSELADKTSELKLLRCKLALKKDYRSYDYDAVEKERDKLQIEVEEMKSNLFSFDATIIPDELSLLADDDEARKLVREVMFSRHLVSESRLQLAESKAFEEDLRKVNGQLSLELKTIQNAYESLQKGKKLVDVELKSERAMLTKKFQQSYDAFEESEAKCHQLEERLEKVKSERDKLLREREDSLRRQREVEEAQPKHDQESLLKPSLSNSFAVESTAESRRLSGTPSLRPGAKGGSRRSAPVRPGLARPGLSRAKPKATRPEPPSNEKLQPGMPITESLKSGSPKVGLQKSRAPIRTGALGSRPLKSSGARPSSSRLGAPSRPGASSGGKRSPSALSPGSTSVLSLSRDYSVSSGSKTDEISNSLSYQRGVSDAEKRGVTTSPIKPSAHPKSSRSPFSKSRAGLPQRGLSKKRKF